jgi:precorrin-6B methylase 2
MVSLQSLPRSLAVMVLAASFPLGTALAQSSTSYQPREGQQGKDVVWVPTAQSLVDKMLDMAKATPDDFVMDLGSGDGRTVITAAKRGINALGIEYNPDMVELSKSNAKKAKVTDKANFTKADLFETDFSKATVVTMFLLPDINIRLRPKILDMKPGTRIVSNTFDLGDWAADATATVEDDCRTYCTAYLWIVPAKVQGTWKTSDSELKLKQQYQLVSGTMTTGNVIAPISDGKLIGDQITFTAGGTHYIGKVNGDKIEGTSRSSGKEGSWSATRGS